MDKRWHDRSWDEYLYWQTPDKRTLKKINNLIRDIERSGDKGLGQGELLKGNLTGWISVKIDARNRLVYKITGDGDNRFLEIAQCKGYYSDK
jgi:toxin YoeB